MNFPFVKSEENEEEKPNNKWGVSFVDLEEPKKEENV